MPQLFLNIHNGMGVTQDDEGREFPNPERALAAAVEGARSLLAAEVMNGRLDLRGRIEVADESGRVLETVRFADVVEVLTGQLPPSGAREGG